MQLASSGARPAAITATMEASSLLDAPCQHVLLALCSAQVPPRVMALCVVLFTTQGAVVLGLLQLHSSKSTTQRAVKLDLLAWCSSVAVSSC